MTADSNNNEQKLASMYSCSILDTESSERFRRITQLLATLFNVEIALISFFDKDELWIRAQHGIDAEQHSEALGQLLENTKDDEPLIISDTHVNDQYRDHPLAQAPLNVRFIAAMPLITEAGYRLGTLTALDSSPLELNDQQIAGIQSLATIVIDEIELHKVNNKLVARNWELEDSFDMLQHQFMELKDHAERLEANGFLSNTDTG